MLATGLCNRIGPRITSSRGAEFGIESRVSETNAVPADVGEYYDRRQREAEKELAACEVRFDKIARVRGLSFLAACVLLGIGLVRHIPAVTWASLLPGLVFVGGIVQHLRVASRRTQLENRLALVKAGQKRLLGELPEPDGSAGPDPFGERFVKADHPNAADLDLFGRTSIFRLICRAETAVGQETFASWLLSPAAPGEIAERQGAIRELLGAPDFLEELAFEGRRASSVGRAEDPLVVWAEAPAEISFAPDAPAAARKRRPLVILGAVLVVITAVTFLGQDLLAKIHPMAQKAFWATFVLQIIVLGILFGATNRVIAFVTSRENPFGRFRRLFELVEGHGFSSRLLADARATLRGDGTTASQEIRSLERILSFADLRHNGIIHLVANLFFLYDVWMVLLLERWRARSGRRARKWLRAVGTVEAVASQATFALENPDYAFPEVTEVEPGGGEAAHFVATKLAHPLISRQKRVANDVAIEAPLRGLLITGSNMSGKSTHLRSMGIAVVMAMAGSVVCAQRLSLSWMRVYTSMRIRDSLEQGISHFYAELLRLKVVQDGVRADPRAIFLLDEILHGTNSRERTIGAKSVVAELCRAGAIGAVSSHDLGLVSLEAENRGMIVNKHFSDRIEDGVMRFDYKLQDGVVSSTNALRLMKAVGLDVSLDDEPPVHEADSVETGVPGRA